MASIFGGSSSQPSTTIRPLVLQHQSVRLSIPIPSTSESWIAAEVAREEFYHSLESEPEFLTETAALGEYGEVDAAEAIEFGKEQQVKLLARFMDFITLKTVSDSSSSLSAPSDLSEISLAAYNRFNSGFLSNISIHSLVESYDVDARTRVLAAYYKSFASLRQVYGKEKVELVQTSGLLKDAQEGKAELHALFSGQGSNEVSVSVYRVKVISKQSLITPLLNVFLANLKLGLL